MKKKNILIIVIPILIITLVVLAIFMARTAKEPNKIVLSDQEYLEKSEEIFKIYKKVSCFGNLYFQNVKKYDKMYIVDEIDNDTLLKYVISYLDIHGQLPDANKKIVNETAKKLFSKKIKFDTSTTEYRYIIYNIGKEGISKEKATCNTDRKYVSNIFGISHDKDYMYINMDIGYVLNGDLYSLENVNLGKYDEDKNPLELFTYNSYYELRYELYDDDSFRLYSVMLKQKF